MTFNLTNSTTQYDSLKARVIELYKTLLEKFDNDIESGIDEGIYEEKENVETRALIEEATKIIEDFKKYQPVLYMYIEGGQIQGMSATENIFIIKFDHQDYLASKEPWAENEYMEGMTPESWDTLINQKTTNGEIKAIY
jgi:hypothetical protein